jgi:hypothetical protein
MSYWLPKYKLPLGNNKTLIMKGTKLGNSRVAIKIKLYENSFTYDKFNSKGGLVDTEEKSKQFLSTSLTVAKCSNEEITIANAALKRIFDYFKG